MVAYQNALAEDRQSEANLNALILQDQQMQMENTH
jgi:hypothetical protein